MFGVVGTESFLHPAIANVTFAESFVESRDPSPESQAPSPRAVDGLRSQGLLQRNML